MGLVLTRNLGEEVYLYDGDYLLGTIRVRRIECSAGRGKLVSLSFSFDQDIIITRWRMDEEDLGNDPDHHQENEE